MSRELTILELDRVNRFFPAMKTLAGVLNIEYNEEHVREALKVELRSRFSKELSQTLKGLDNEQLLYLLGEKDRRLKKEVQDAEKTKAKTKAKAKTLLKGKKK